MTAECEVFVPFVEAYLGHIWTACERFMHRDVSAIEGA
jgi:hypothetical protein